MVQPEAPGEPMEAAAGSAAHGPGEEVLFHEVQRYRIRAMWLLVFFSAGMSYYAFYTQIIAGRQLVQSPPWPDWLIWLMFAVAGVLIPALFAAARLVVDVTREGVRIRYVPVVDRMVTLGELRSYKRVTYNGPRDFGGWGIRWQAKKRMQVYTAAGDAAVEFELASKEGILLGTQRPDDLVEAIKRAKAKKS